MFGNPATASAVTFCFTHTQSTADGLQQKIKQNSRSSGGLLFTIPLTAAKLTWLEQIEVSTFGELRQVERYQLKTAERFYTKGEYAAAAAGTKKFITLYETSAGSTLRAIDVEPLPGQATKSIHRHSGRISNRHRLLAGIDRSNAGFLSHWPVIQKHR